MTPIEEIRITKKIYNAIVETLVIKNQESVHLAVGKILKLIK